MYILHKILKLITGFVSRLDLIEECKKLKRAGRFLPKNYKYLLFKSPSRYDDFVHFLCFLDNNKEVNLVDVGANQGNFSKDFLIFFPKTKQILLFEPLKELNSQIHHNLNKFKNYKIINKALGEKKNL
jgi:hypothetical protein